ncbi:hypothetical protein Ddye_009566 [Dipteronia dyeriana]|uniref:RING-type E3 ubiquitin transferase n=1 Tax=Dipteronia dyeriana TaxID=168575 RepID=A0AAE0CMG9_9ROSI|nr:hypothetical protein Ddye_009566 [Dipteronia dyeriana]
MAVLSVLVCMTVVGLLLVVFYAAIRAYYLRRNDNSTRRRRDPPIFFGTQEDFIDEDHEPASVDHPIWYINTIGLSQSVIDSITVFKYKKDEGLIEGTDCSVCLNEFQEDENLRLLPKCSHAFHITCIDTWLRSHKNCPLCRAPVINGTIADQASELEPNLIDSDSRNESMVENQEMIHVGEGGTSEVRNNNGHDDDSCFAPDLADNNMQPMRRSVSLDSSSAMAIHNAVANVVLVNGNTHQGKSKNSKSKMVAKSSSCSVSSSISSSGSSLQKGPVSMKRSFSFSGKRSSSSRHSRRHSILPL